MAKRAPTSAARSERGSGRSVAPTKPPKLRLAGSSSPPQPASSSGRVAEPARPAGPAADALTSFEVALTAMQKHDYQAAAERFKGLLTDFPNERPLLDRVRVYLDHCERELRRAPIFPHTIEERLTSATAALNNGDDRTAERLAAEVLSQSPDHDLALYLLAAVHARQGDASTAIRHLRRAMEVSPDVQAQARHDADFEFLKGHEEFQQLIEVAGASDRGQGRRARRPRADR